MLFIQLYYYFFVLGKFAFQKYSPSAKSIQEPVSVVIAARNELENLQRFLPSVLQQNYPEFEVVVVNHCSWDGSQAWLEEMQQTHKHLKVSQLIEQERYPTGKKFALTIGIKAAKYDQLLFTDADCEPVSNQWIQLMQSRFTNRAEIVLGYSPIVKQKGLLNMFQQFIHFITAQFYFSYALKGKAFMGVGRNLAYRKEVFFRHKGFASHQHIMSGDDDLFVNQAANAYNVAIEYNADSFVATLPKETFEKFARQKTRHMTTGKYYKSQHKWALGIYYFSLVFFYILVIALPVIQLEAWPIVLAMYVVRFIAQLIISYQAASKLKCTYLVWFLPMFDFFYLCYILLFGTKSLFIRNTKVW